MNDPQKSSFFDGNMFLVIALVVLGWMGWQSYLSKKYPDAYERPVATQEKISEIEVQDSSTKENLQGVSTPSAQSALTQQEDRERAQSPRGSVQNGRLDQVEEIEETFTHYEDDVWALTLSSKGMALKEVILKNYSDRDENPIVFSGAVNQRNLETALVGSRTPIDFLITQTDDQQFFGEAEVNGLRITKIMVLDSEHYTISTQVNVSQITDNFTGLVTRFGEEVVEKTRGFLFAPQFDIQEFYVNHDGSTDRTYLAPAQEVTQTYSKTQIAGIGSQYFAMAVVDNSNVMPDFRAISVASSENTSAIGALTHTMLSRSDQFSINYKAYVGPKSFYLLQGVDQRLTDLINLGWFKAIARTVLRLLHWVHGWIGNWGLAIIVLTIFVRILVLPFNLMSYKSMKGMAKIQPQMKELRVKYKDNPQKLNQEVLRLMKEAKANPIGGCLPMLLQIPVFFALYQVLGQSIELYKAPFMLWISDLSLKDPLFVLPILMGITMYAQLKITPTTMEPAQQKVLMFMPFLFTGFMLALPSGLTLYIFISALFGVLQQIYFMKDDIKAKRKEALEKTKLAKA